MRFIAILFTAGALALAVIFGAWSMHAYAGCGAGTAMAGCTYDRHMFSIALLVLMAGIASVGALLVTKQTRS